MTRNQKELLSECLCLVLRPIIKLMLDSGLNCSEFLNIVRTVYVRIATTEYGIRGRPTNISRVAALTGLSRRQVSRIRRFRDQTDWSPDDATNPINTIIHYWRFDERYVSAHGVGKELPSSGANSFDELAKTYVSGIPSSTLKKEMIRQGIVAADAEGWLTLLKDYAYPSSIDEDFFRNWAFSLSSLAGTLEYNARLIGEDSVSDRTHISKGRFQQIAWSRRLPESETQALQAWVRGEGHRFIQSADSWIARHETQKSCSGEAPTCVSGVGLYYFVNDAAKSDDPDP